MAEVEDITLPLVLYATAPLLIVQYAENFNDFTVIYLFNKGGRGAGTNRRGVGHPVFPGVKTLRPRSSTTPRRYPSSSA